MPIEKMISRLRKYPFFILLLISVAVASRSVSASDLPQSGDRYEIIRPVYLDAWYYNLSNKQVNKEAAHAYLEAQRGADRAWHAFRSDVPVGTIMTIIGPAQKVRYFFFFTSKIKRYIVRLEPDISRGLDIEMSLDRGIEGSLDGLNSEIFRRLEEKAH